MEINFRLFAAISKHYVNSQTRSRAFPVIEIVISVVEIHVNVVRVIPSVRPRVVHPEPESAVLKARKSADNELRVETEIMVAAEIGAETIIGNASVRVLETARLALRCSKISAVRRSALLRGLQLF